MGTKSNPGTYDCYAKAQEDEPLFTLLGRDELAPILVRTWAACRKAKEGLTEKVQEAYTCAEAMEQWRQDRLKV